MIRLRPLFSAAALTVAFALPASADMALDDLTKVDLSAFAMPDYAVKKEANRITVVCIVCGGFSAIDVHLAAGPNDGTEERIRSGQTTAETMLDVCKKNVIPGTSECYDIKKADLKGAVGFVSDVKANGTSYSATYTLYQDGKLLLMRNISDSREKAAKLGALAYEHIAPQVVR